MLIHASMIRKFMQISSALNSYKKTAHIISPHWDEFISAVPPKFLM